MDKGVDTNLNKSASDGGHPTSQSSRLCHACLSVLTRQTFQSNRCYSHHESLKDFIEASRMKCYICSWMLSVLSEDCQEILTALAEERVSNNMVVTNKHDSVSDSRTRLWDSLDTKERWRKWDSRVSFTGMELLCRPNHEDEVSIGMYLNPSYQGYFPLETRAYDGWLRNFWADMYGYRGFTHDSGLVLMTHEALKPMEIPTTLPSNTGSIETWLTIEKWIKHCSKHHRCMAGVDANWYPTRLVERTSDDTFRLIRSDSSKFLAGQDRRYITLSHRWGNSEFLKLTTDNLSSLEKGLSVKALRKIFQETLVVAQRMNISYVWIDSLCIIQSGDDLADWGQEAKTMQQVYSNSFCNISADWGDESNGLFFERTTAFAEPCSLQLRRKSPAKFHDRHSILDRFRRILRSRPAVHPWHILRLPKLLEDVTQSPINRRGWVLQERLLSPRVVHFSPEQVTWECLHGVAWEKAQADLPELSHLSSSSPLWTRHWQAKKNMQRLSFSDGSEHSQGVPWQLLVETYTKCDLTKQSDKLIAFAGIARRLAPAGGQYVAGLWAASMPGTLLWEVRPYRPSTKESRCWLQGKYYAPTFSWAAADGVVSMENFRTEPLAIASTAFIKHRDKPPHSTANETILMDNVFGPLTSPVAEVRVRGILRSCRRVPPQLVSAEWKKQPVEYPNDDCACPSSSVDDSAIDTCFESGTAFQVIWDHTDVEFADENRAMYYYTLVECGRYEDRGDPGSYYWASGLFLKSVDESMARFERVGLVRHTSRHQADIRAPLGNERDLPAWSYDEATGEHMFYIV